MLAVFAFFWSLNLEAGVLLAVFAFFWSLGLDGGVLLAAFAFSWTVHVMSMLLRDEEVGSIHEGWTAYHLLRYLPSLPWTEW